MHAICWGKYSYFDFIMVLHIISYKIITTVGIYTKFFLLVWDIWSEIMFSSVSMSQKKIQQLEIHECQHHCFGMVGKQWFKMWEWQELPPLPLLIPINVSNGAKIRNRYNQVPHLTQDTNGKVTNSQKTPQTRAKRSALSQQVTTKHI